MCRIKDASLDSKDRVKRKEDEKGGHNKTTVIAVVQFNRNMFV